jgi:signal peptidase II
MSRFLPLTPVLKRTALLAVTLFILDQASKQWIVNHLALFDGFPLTSFFNIVRVHNAGAAFSFLANAGGWQQYFFTALGIVVSGYLVWMMWQSPHDSVQCTALGLIVSGALGNVMDRLRFGYVVDFLDVHGFNYHWPAFNVADSCICVGAALLIFDEIRKMRAATLAKHSPNGATKHGHTEPMQPSKQDSAAGGKDA